MKINKALSLAALTITAFVSVDIFIFNADPIQSIVSISMFGAVGFALGRLSRVLEGSDDA